MEEIILLKPSMEYENQVMNYKRVFEDNNQSFDGCAGLEEVSSYKEWINLDKRLKNKYGDQYVPSTVYLAIRKLDNKLIGIIDLRHGLFDFLYKYGGHIGYSVIIEERKKGHAKEMLSLAIRKCKKHGMSKVLLTCDKENIASSKTILSNGGILENEIKDVVGFGKSGIVQRYWINL